MEMKIKKMMVVLNIQKNYHNNKFYVKIYIILQKLNNNKKIINIKFVCVLFRENEISLK